MTVRPVPLSCLDTSPELLQSGFWGAFKEGYGWKAFPFEVSAGPATFGLLVLVRRLAGRFPIAYVPFGPVHDPGAGRGGTLALIARAVRESLPKGTLFLRFDLPWARDGESPAGPRLRKCRSDMQPASTVVVDISVSAEQVLAAMKPKTRYNIRLAGKKGVTVVEGTPADVPSWYALYQETARRDRIGIHSRAYYQGLLQSAAGYSGEAPCVQLLLARHEGELLAGNIVAYWKDRAAYLYGASSGAKRNLMPTYALQWEAITRAQARGCRTYDLFGVPPRPDPGHPMFGLYQFKTGFSEQVRERWGTWDAVYRPGLRALFGAAEAARMFYYRGLKKRMGRGGTPAAAT
ncbi:MAG TPA: peptidoglycan bridge formation glycyltransferase FemA/FemB family protein [Spirochaetia bacterium]|nr:peptidoglycan bridge formation glycyltransferase FemA/FemB family protein [Spirochaetia bacterium]